MLKRLFRLTVRLARWGVKTAVIVMAVVLLGAAIGFYDVAATSGHPPPVKWLLNLSMHRSVKMYANFAEKPPEFDHDMVQLGAAQFDTECVVCHGAPGVRQDPVVKGMLPAPPPDLARTTPDWTKKQLFRLVKHGLKYTSMPPWAAPSRDEEIWSMVAFLKALPSLSPADYRAFASGNAKFREPRDAKAIIAYGPHVEAAPSCARCHDSADTDAPNHIAPMLSGLSESYLRRQLKDFRSGKRKSGFMTPVASELDDSDITALAAYYAKLPARTNGEPPADPETLARGRELALVGAQNEDAPACETCHNADSEYPRLAGQHRRYIEMQLVNWRRGDRSKTKDGKAMALIVRNLTDRQIKDIAAYFAAHKSASSQQTAAAKSQEAPQPQ